MDCHHSDTTSAAMRLLEGDLAALQRTSHEAEADEEIAEKLHIFVRAACISRLRLAIKRGENLNRIRLALEKEVSEAGASIFGSVEAFVKSYQNNTVVTAQELSAAGGTDLTSRSLALTGKLPTFNYDAEAFDAGIQIGN
jgi:hypothetical protein